MKREIVKLAGLILLTSFLTVVCEDKQTAFTSGTYHYVGYDLDNGWKVTEGEISIMIEDSLISGQKNIRIVGAVTQDVQDTGTGLIQGRIKSDGTVEIYLLNSPGPYLVIRGSFDNGALRGKRYYCLEVLEADIGTFVAEKI